MQKCTMRAPPVLTVSCLDVSKCLNLLIVWTEMVRRSVDPQISLAKCKRSGYSQVIGSTAHIV